MPIPPGRMVSAEATTIHQVSRLGPACGRIQCVNKCPVIAKTCVVSPGKLAEISPAMNEFAPSQPGEIRCETCPLTAVRTGVAVRIRKLCATPEVQERLRELGLCEDQVIRLVTNQTNFICQVCNARLALSQQLAQLIWVEPVLQPAHVTSR